MSSDAVRASTATRAAPSPFHGLEKKVLFEIAQVLDNSLRDTLYRSTNYTRESFREEEVRGALIGYFGWHKIKGAWYMEDKETGVIFLKKNNEAEPQVCVPHHLVPEVSVYEHVKYHADTQDKDKADSEISKMYKGVTREHLRVVRKQCPTCQRQGKPLIHRPFELSRDAQKLVTTRIRGSAICSAGGGIVHAPKAAIDAPAALFEVRDPDAAVNPQPGPRSGNGRLIVWANFDLGNRRKNIVPSQSVTLERIAIESGMNVPSCFSLDMVEKIKRELGAQFVQADSDVIGIHQSVVTTAILSNICQCDVEYWNKAKLVERCKEPPTRASYLFLLQWSHAPVLDARVDGVYTWFSNQLPSLYGVDTRCFPAKSELYYAESKLPDIRALDELANYATPEWSFRPRTCESLHSCNLQGRTVLKRTNSCGSDHVILDPDENLLVRHLLCRSDQGLRNNQCLETSPRWFHQEYVQGLRSGEYRVFIVSVRDPDALRGRRGVVVEVIHTIERQDKNLVIEVLKRSFGLADDGSCDLQKLEAFSLFVYERLRQRRDWQEHYESLEVGVRLDVGVAINSGCRQPFVNEVTRIYVADFFSTSLAEPGLFICKTVADAMKEVIMDEM